MKLLGYRYRVEVQVGLSWHDMPGERAATAALTTEAVDTSDKDSNGWRELNPFGVTACEVTVAGIVTKQTGRIGLIAVMESFFNKTHINVRVVSSGNLVIYQGPFEVANIERSGDFNNAEAYTVKLSSARTITASESVTVEIASSASGGEAPFEIMFSATVVGGDVATYLWDFGDGYTSADAAPAHLFETPGSYTVTLTITTTDGAVAQATTAVDITGIVGGAAFHFAEIRIMERLS